MSSEIKVILLAAGLGSRLMPLTGIWPKCLMPIRSRPLLEYWLNILYNLKIKNVLVNTHYLSEHVKEFLIQDRFKNWVNIAYESSLFGTAGTIRKNIDFVGNDNLLLIHADNWCCCNFNEFVDYHLNKRPNNTLITMMLFKSENPSSCGIVEIDSEGIVAQFHEKITNPPGDLANAAVYLLDPAVVEWIEDNPEINDFSTEVLPRFIGRIATWENKKIHRDIGTIEALKEAQKDNCEFLLDTEDDSAWQKDFLNNPIHNLIKKQ